MKMNFFITFLKLLSLNIHLWHRDVGNSSTSFQILLNSQFYFPSQITNNDWCFQYPHSFVNVCKDIEE